MYKQYLMLASFFAAGFRSDSKFLLIVLQNEQHLGQHFA